MTKELSLAEKMIGNFSPKLVDLTDQILFVDVWESPDLSKRDRSLVTVTALIALGHTELGRAIENCVKRDGLIETITHLAFYTG